MRTRIFTIILVGMTIGFLLGMAVVILLRAVVDGDDPKLSIAFTVFVVFMAGFLLWYVAKSGSRARMW